MRDHTVPRTGAEAYRARLRVTIVHGVAAALILAAMVGFLLSPGGSKVPGIAFAVVTAVELG